MQVDAKAYATASKINQLRKNASPDEFERVWGTFGLCRVYNLLGPRITTFRTSGFGVETVEYKNLSFTVWRVGGHDKVRSLWRHFYQGTNGLINVVNSNDRNKVVDAQEELNKLIEDEMQDAVVLVLANTLTSSTAARSSQDLTDVRKSEDLRW